MPSRSLASSVLLIALLAGVPAAADEPSTATSRHAAYAAKTASLPAPSAEHGFRFDGVLRFNGKALGHVTLFARPDAKDTTIWHTGDQIVIKTKAQPLIEIAEAFFTRTLGLLRGAVETNKPGAARITWVKTEKGFRGTTQATEGQVTTEQVRNFAHTGTASTTLAGTVLFARSALPEKAGYATTIFEIEHGMRGEEALRPVTMDVLGAAELDGRTVLRVRAQKGEQTLELLFNPEGKELIAVRSQEGEKRIEILKGDLWSMPARDPVTASMRAALALATDDIGLLSDTIYWPQLYKRYLASLGPEVKGKPLSMDAFRTKQLAQFEGKLGKQPPQMMQALLPSLKPQLKVSKLEKGAVVVVYPPMFKNLQFTLGRTYGFWHLIALPGRAKPPAAKPAAPEDAPKDG